MASILNHHDDILFMETLLVDGWDATVLGARFPRLPHNSLLTWASMLAQLSLRTCVARTYHQTLMALCLAYNLLPLQGIVHEARA